MKARSATLGRAVLMALVVAVVSTACGTPQPASPPPPVEAPPPEITPTNLPPEQQAPLLDTAVSIDQAEANIATAERDLASALGRFHQQNPGKVPQELGDATFTDEERAALTALISQERGSRRSLITQITQKDAEIAKLRTSVDALRQQLPANVSSVVAGPNDSHYNMAVAFLRKQGVSADKAVDLVSQINLVQPLVPGFRVWNTYTNGQFGTWVTRGTATMTPQEAQRRIEEALESTKQELAVVSAAAARTKAELTTLGVEADTILKEAETRRQEAEDALRVAELERTRAAIAENAVRYTVGSKRDLERAKIIDGRFGFRGMPDNAPAIDFSQPNQQVLIDPAAYRLRRVRKVTIVPTNAFKEGVDYSWAQQDVGVTITLRNADAFKRNRFFVVVLED